MRFRENEGWLILCHTRYQSDISRLRAAGCDTELYINLRHQTEAAGCDTELVVFMKKKNKLVIIWIFYF